MSRGNSWAPSSGVGPIPGDGRPTPGDMIAMAEESARLEEIAAKLGQSKTEFIKKIPDAKITGIETTISDKVAKVRS
jgi:hypothetical protein